MSVETNTIRLLGGVQLVVFIASMVSERLLASAVGSGTIAEILARISENLTRLRISNLVALVNSAAIVVLGAFFYVVLGKENQTVALVALGLFLAEAITLAVSKIGTFALIPLSREYVQAGAPDPSYLHTLGEFLYRGVDRMGYDLHMLFFCLGGILWYSLLHASGVVPRAISLWGLVAVCLITMPVLLALYDRDLDFAMILGLPYAPFELVLGLWLLVKGG
jgi:hypothetical protein